MSDVERGATGVNRDVRELHLVAVGRDLLGHLIVDRIADRDVMTIPVVGDRDRQLVDAQELSRDAVALFGEFRDRSQRFGIRRNQLVAADAVGPRLPRSGSPTRPAAMHLPLQSASFEQPSDNRSSAAL